MKIKFCIVSLFYLINVSCSQNCLRSKTIKIEPKDFSKLSITSNLSRSELTSSRLYFSQESLRVQGDHLDNYYDETVSLAGGIPDYLPAQSILNALVTVAQNQTHPKSYELHQYTGQMGNQRLLNILAKLYSKLMKRNINPDKEILVTIGASNALMLAMQAFLQENDQVIVFEPFYMDYPVYIKIVGAKMINIPLKVKKGKDGKHSNDWSFDKKELESKINHKTKMILLNNPNNPYGKAFNLDELTYISYLAEKNNLVVVCDEAGEWYQYDDPGHIKIASLPGMFKRTITISSGGKMFSNTGWRIGWAIAPEQMLWGMSQISYATIISVSTPLQIAYAIALENEFKKWGTPDSWWLKVTKYFTKTRNKILYYLHSVGAEYIVPSSSYTIAANFTKLSDQIDLSSETDCRPGMRFVNFLEKKGIKVIRLSIFFDPGNQWRTEYAIRLTNMKTERTIDAFGRKLQTIFKKIN